MNDVTEVEKLIEQDRQDGERADALTPDAMLAGVEYQIAKLDLKPGNILVVRVTREGMTHQSMSRIQYEMQKFIGRKVLVIDGDAELSVIEGAKIKK